MQFTEGIWMDRRGLKVHRAEKIWRYETTADSVKVMVPAHEIRSMNDTTFGPVLTFVFTAPRKDMISVKVTHYRGKKRKGPSFELNAEDVSPNITDADGEIIFASGRLEARIAKDDLFRFAFYFDGKPLTAAGAKSAAYVTDLDYESDKIRDYNRRESAPYGADTWIRSLLDLDVGEYVYGLGERFTPLVRNGQSADIWNRDGGSGCDQAYKSIPFYVSSKGYGVFVNSPGYVNFEFATANTRCAEFSTPGESMEYIVIGANNPKGALSKYTALIGRSPVPPAWSFGLWLSTSWEPESSEKTVMEFVDGMAQRDIPLSVFHFDARWMDDFNCCDFVWSDRFGDAKALLAKIHAAGAKVCVWINPYVSQEGRLFDEGVAGGYFLLNRDGDVWQVDGWMSGMAIVDFTNPAACEWYADRLGEIVDMGVDVIKTDFGERIPTDVRWFDGSDPELMHNYYPYLYNKVIFDMLKKRKGEREACVFSRSATVGTQLFPINWGGDNEATYVSMAESLRGGLSLCMSGYGFWAHDITGFGGTATPDLYKRWVAFGMLNTHSRLHGKETYRVPWAFDEECVDVLRFFTKLKCRLAPYLYAGAVRVHEEGIPLMQSMALAYPDDRTCLPLETQYMLGDDLLVAPVFRDDGEATFYLPQGSWTDFISAKRYEGGRWHTVKYDYYGLPLLAREGAVIPTGSVDGTVVYDYAKDAVFRWYEPTAGAGERRTVAPVYRADGRPAMTAVAQKDENGYAFTVTAPARAEGDAALGEAKGSASGGVANGGASGGDINGVAGGDTCGDAAPVSWRLLWFGHKPNDVTGGAIRPAPDGSGYLIEPDAGCERITFR